MTAIDLASGKITKVSKSLEMLGSKSREVTLSTNNFNNAVKVQEKTMEGLPKRFKMQYLSVLFFGMAIQRISMMIARSATQVYLKITEGQTSAAQSLIALSAGFTYLSFSVGEALGRFLEPFIPTILSLIEGFSDWISQNETLVVGIIILGLVIGTLLLTIGTLKLGLTGIATLMGIDVVLSATTASAAFVTLSYYLSGFWVLAQLMITDLATKFALFGSSMLGTALIGVTAAILLYLAWENNLLGIKTLTYDVFAGVARTLLIIVQGVINLMWTIAKAGEIFGVFGSGTQKMFAGLAKDLEKTSAEWQKFIDYTTTPEAKTGIIESRPLSDLIKQSIGEIQNYITNNPANSAPSIFTPTLTTTIGEINLTTMTQISKEDIEKYVKRAVADANAETIDIMRRYTNVTVGR